MAGLSEFIAKLSRLEGAAVERRVLARIRDVTHAEAVRGFQQKVDPYGKSWEPRKRPTGDWPLLDKTGAGIDSLTARIVGHRVRLSIKGAQWKFIQRGTSRMVARMVFPDPAQGLGTWREPIQDAVRVAVREIVEAAA